MFKDYAKKEFGWDVKTKGSFQVVNVTSLSQFVDHHSITEVTYASIDVEGFEATVVQGMRLEDPKYRRIFPAFQIELGGTWRDGDPRKPQGSLSLTELSGHLDELGYDLFLLADAPAFGFKISKDAIKIICAKDRGVVDGNMLVVSRSLKFQSPPMNHLFKKWLQKFSCYK